MLNKALYKNKTSKNGNSKKAFTLIELVICFIMIGIVATLAINSYNKSNFKDKYFVAAALKVINEYNDITSRLLNEYPENFPVGAMIQDIGGGYTYEIYKDGDSQEKADSQDILNIYAKKTKFKRTKIKIDDNIEPLKFCNYTDCSVLGLDEGSNLPAAQWFTDVYIAFEVGQKVVNEEIEEGEEGRETTEETFECPSYYYPGDDEQTVYEENDKKRYCWGKLYVDVNGIKAPNQLGKDIFVFGLGELGIVFK